ncbi:hypothetical protein PPYR_00252 [Photinus pyralis]|uniref:DUF3456 domain-containing protein n=1 Tax=Photinus pyralis TaxID=7054 RepID=A0A1Y1K0K3_PHOPY|nr:protein seele [Photinus pyralis]KAB0803282.1 hypothetical protein PPYR_00252 [Photinus pyralis]
MNKIILSFLFLTLILHTESTVHIDVKELQCLICKVAIDELHTLIKQIDPNRKVDVGGYRIDSTGNFQQKTVSEAKSEVHLSELADKACDKIDDYVRATWKDSGKLTLLRLTTSSGSLNSDISSVDIIQDDDLNKSLKYYCDGIINDYEDSIIDHFKNEGDVAYEVCNRESNLCTEFDKGDEKRTVDEL